MDTYSKTVTAIILLMTLIMIVDKHVRLFKVKYPKGADKTVSFDWNTLEYIITNGPTQVSLADVIDNYNTAELQVRYLVPLNGINMIAFEGHFVKEPRSNIWFIVTQDTILGRITTLTKNYTITEAGNLIRVTSV
jgi:hypothetical protein